MFMILTCLNICLRRFMGMNNMRIDRDTFEEYLRRLQTTKGKCKKG